MARWQGEAAAEPGRSRCWVGAGAAGAARPAPDGAPCRGSPTTALFSWDDRTAMEAKDWGGAGARPGGPRVTVIGFDGQPASAQARALNEATLVIGNIRRLDRLPVPKTARRIYMGGFGSALTHLALNDGPAVVVAWATRASSASYGRCANRASGCAPCPRSPRWPPPSAGSAWPGRTRWWWPWTRPRTARTARRTRRAGSRAVPDPITGRPVSTLRAAANVCRTPEGRGAAGPSAGPRELAAELLGDGKAGPERTLVVAQRLGEPEESVEWLSLAEAADRHIWGEPNVVLCLDEDRPPALRPALTGGWSGPPGAWALPENAFVHRGAQVLSPEVRALVLARLAPRPGTMVWDVEPGPGQWASSARGWARRWSRWSGIRTRASGSG